MTVAQFPYLDVDPSAGGLGLMPYVPITLTVGDVSVSGEGLIDSEAALNVLPWELGLQLGFVWDSQTVPLHLQGNLAASEARGVVVEATVGQFPKVLLGFAWTQLTKLPILLGQTNFFREFEVCFFRSRSLFEVRQRQP